LKPRRGKGFHAWGTTLQYERGKKKLRTRAREKISFNGMGDSRPDQEVRSTRGITVVVRGVHTKLTGSNGRPTGNLGEGGGVSWSKEEEVIEGGGWVG